MDYRAFENKFKHFFGDEWQFIYHQNKQRLNLKNQRIATTKLATIIPAVFKIARQNSYSGMTLRDLSRETGYSTGGLYKYFNDKEDLFVMIHHALVAMTERVLISVQSDNPLTSIDHLLIYHLYMSERLKRWFYFVFMEAKHLNKPLLNRFVESEKLLEQALITDINKAVSNHLCHCRSAFLVASVLKATLQEWYLKNHKYQAQNIDLTAYKNHLLTLRQQLLPEAHHEQQ